MRILARSVPTIPLPPTAERRDEGAELQRLRERVDHLEKDLLEQRSAAAKPSEDLESLQRLTARVEALELRPLPTVENTVAEIPDALPALKAELAQKLETALRTAEQKSATLEERLRSCEQAPRLLTETVIKEVETRLHARLTTIEKTWTQKLAEVSQRAALAPAPAPTAAAPDWNARFEQHEAVLAGLMKEITSAAASTPLPPSPEDPASLTSSEEAPIVMEAQAVEPQPELFIPEPSAAETSEDFALPSATRRSVVARFWNYLNEPAFGDSARSHNSRLTD